jgi:hypothetical protein
VFVRTIRTARRSTSTCHNGRLKPTLLKDEIERPQKHALVSFHMHHVQTFCKIPFTTKRSSPPRTLVPHRHRKIRVLPPLPQQVPHRRSCVSTLTQNRCSRHKQRVRMQQTHNSVKMYHLSKDPCANLLVLVLICGAGISAGRNTDKHTHTHAKGPLDEEVALRTCALLLARARCLDS